MPTYQYLCRNCEHRFDVVQSIHDEPLTLCPECAGTIRRVLHPVGVTFKGSGFYRTDSREAKTTKATKTASGQAKETAGAKSGTESTSAATSSNSEGGGGSAAAKKSDAPAGATKSKAVDK